MIEPNFEEAVKPITFTIDYTDVLGYLEEEIVFGGQSNLMIFDDPVNEVIAQRNCTICFHPFKLSSVVLILRQRVQNPHERHFVSSGPMVRRKHKRENGRGSDSQ